MPKLSWISDNDIETAVSALLAMASKAKQKATAEFGKNIVDPFSAIFEMSGFNIDYTEWVISEGERQAQKTLQNFIGDFHQIILGSCTGWANMQQGNIIDLRNSNAKIIAEVKNKYNTLTGGKQSDLYFSLEDAVMDKTSIYKDFTAYYVTIIPKKPQRFNKEFTPSNKAKGQKCASNPLIRQIDGASFYELVTGIPNSLEDLYDALPDVIAAITNNDILDRQQLKGLFKIAYG